MNTAMDDETRKKKSWPPDWQYQYETRVLRPLREVAIEAGSKVSGVTFDFQGKCLSVLVREGLNDQEKKSVRTSLQLAAKKLDSSGRDYRVHFHHPPQYAYVWHGLELDAFEDERLNARNTEFKIKVEELLSLSKAYRLLAEESSSFDHVATFARGGIPALNFISRHEFENRSTANPDDPLTELVEKFHLFPNLKSPHTRSLVADWLGRIKKPSILVFDTGTEGNGARGALEVVKEYLISSMSSFVRRVRIIGIVDGPSKDQITDYSQSISTLSGETIAIKIDYIPVSCVLTEDCTTLLGYDTLKSKARAKPVKKRALLRLINETSSRSIEIGALSASAVLNEIIRNPDRFGLNLGGTTTAAHFELVAGMLRARSRASNRATENGQEF